MIFFCFRQTLPQREFEPKIGFRKQLSAYDIEEIKYHYNCGKKNKSNSLCTQNNEGVGIHMKKRIIIKNTYIYMLHSGKFLGETGKFFVWITLDLALVVFIR